MACVLVFARILVDQDIFNVTNMAFDLNPNSDSTSRVENDVYFKKDGFFKMNEEDYVEYSCSFTKVINDDIIVLGGTQVPLYLKVEKFKAFRKTSSDIIFFNINTNVGNRFINIINRLGKRIIFERINIDFENVARKVETVVGSWFSIPSADISTKSLHGPDILNSSDFKELYKNATITSLNVNYFYLGMLYLVIISGKGSVYLTSKIEPREMEKIILVDLTYKLIVNITNQ